MSYPTQKPFRMNNEDYAEFDEQGLFSQQMDEGCELFGAHVVYIDVLHAQPDQIFGEYLGKMMEEGTDMYLLLDQVEEDFQNEDAMMHAKFGIQFNFSECTFWGSTDYFSSFDVTPAEGDLIYYPKIEKMFEISKVTKQHKFKYKIDCDLYNYDNIKVDEDAIDDAPVQDLEFINDEEVTVIETPQTDQITDEDIISGRDNNLY